MSSFFNCPVGEENTNEQLERTSNLKLDINDRTDMEFWINNIYVSTTIWFVS